MSFSEDSLTYPMEGDDWIRPFAIGSVLTLLSILVVPAFLVAGYLVRTIRERSQGATQPPEFDDWGGYLVDGLKATVIYLVYMIVPTVIFAATVGTAIFGILTGSRAGASLGGATFIIGGLASFVLSLVFGYFALAALVNFSVKEDLGAAFDFGTIWGLALSKEYAIPWLISIGVIVAANILIGFLQVIPILGAVLAAPVVFYAYVVVANILAGGYNDAMGVGGGTTTSTTATI